MKNDDSTRQFAAELRLLQRHCGAPSLNQLSRLSALPRSTIGDVLSGTTAPKLEPVLKIVDSLLLFAAQQEVLVASPENAVEWWRHRWERYHESADDRPRGALAPQQLPSRPNPFVGRTAEMAALDRHTSGGGARVIVVDGPAGCGKSALVVEWAHDSSARWPDGQIYHDLEGFGPGEPQSQIKALHAILRGLGVDVSSLSTDVNELAALYRSQLAGRRILLVLDNAGSSEQVRPLIPATPGNTLVVTSRSRLSGLLVRDGATRLTLDALPMPAAVELLTALAADSTTSPLVLADIATICGRLPLALRLVAYHVRSRSRRVDGSPEPPDGAWQAAVEELFDDIGDPSTQLDSVLSWSIRELPSDQLDAFLLLASATWSPFDIELAAHVLDLSPEATRCVLRSLHELHLIEARDSTSYAFHDLVRDWGTRTARRRSDTGRLAVARGRALTYYLFAADLADRILLPPRSRPEIVAAGARPAWMPCMPDAHAAYAWFDAHLQDLVQVARRARELGAGDVARQLPYIAISYLNLAKPWTEWIELTDIALAEPVVSLLSGHLHNIRGIALKEVGRIDEAIATFETARDEYRISDSVAGESLVLNNIANAERARGDISAAVRTLHEALTLAIESHDERGRAIVMHNLAEGYLDADERPEKALKLIQEARRICLEEGDLDGAAAALTTIGRAQERTGDHDSAAASYAQAVSELTETSDLLGLAYAHIRSGRLLARRHQREDARLQLRTGLRILESLGEPSAADVRAELDRFERGRETVSAGGRRR